MFEKLYMVGLTYLCAYGLLDLMIPDFGILILFNKHFFIINCAIYNS